jgi:hypothetical protein
MILRILKSRVITRFSIAVPAAEWSRLCSRVRQDRRTSSLAPLGSSTTTQTFPSASIRFAPKQVSEQRTAIYLPANSAWVGKRTITASAPIKVTVTTLLNCSPLVA